MSRESTEPRDDESALDAVFLYMGILDAYEAVGVELIGPDVLDDHVLPRMVYYVQEFLPEVFSQRAESDELVDELKEFLLDFKDRVETAMEKGSAEDITMEDIWKLRAAIFGYESVFINILGETAIKSYVFTRMADILSAYLPARMLDPSIPLRDKLQAYVDFIRDHGFVKYSRVSFDEEGVQVATNHCAFSQIHDSDAYRDLDVRFCPWGMIASAIVTSHQGTEAQLSTSVFTTKGSVSNIKT